MSGFLSVKHRDCIQILTDGAAYDDKHRLAKVSRKVFHARNMPIAVTSRGQAGIGDWLSQRICDLADKQGSVDVVLDALPRIVQILKAAAGDFLTGEENAIEVLVAGWSETKGPRHCVFRTRSVDSWHVTWEVIEMPEREISGGIAVSTSELLPWMAQFGLTPATAMEKLDGDPANMFRRYGAEMAECWRRHMVPGLSNVFLIGGQVDLTEIRPEGVTVTTLRTWPDKIGEKINPFAGTNVAPIAGMSRKQRRAAEREARKGRAA